MEGRKLTMKIREIQNWAPAITVVIFCCGKAVRHLPYRKK